MRNSHIYVLYSESVQRCAHSPSKRRDLKLCLTAISLPSADSPAGLSGRLPGASGCCQATARAYYGDEPVQRVHYEVCYCWASCIPSLFRLSNVTINFGRSSLTLASNFEREIATLRSLRHRNLVGTCYIDMHISIYFRLHISICFRLSRCSWLLDLAVQIYVSYLCPDQARSFSTAPAF